MQQMEFTWAALPPHQHIGQCEGLRRRPETIAGLHVKMQMRHRRPPGTAASSERLAGHDPGAYRNRQAAAAQMGEQYMGARRRPQQHVIAPVVGQIGIARRHVVEVIARRNDETGNRRKQRRAKTEVILARTAVSGVRGSIFENFEIERVPPLGTMRVWPVEALRHPPLAIERNGQGRARRAAQPADARQSRRLVGSLGQIRRIEQHGRRRIPCPLPERTEPAPACKHEGQGQQRQVRRSEDATERNRQQAGGDGTEHSDGSGMTAGNGEDAAERHCRQHEVETEQGRIAPRKNQHRRVPSQIARQRQQRKIARCRQ